MNSSAEPIVAGKTNAEAKVFVHYSKRHRKRQKKLVMQKNVAAVPNQTNSIIESCHPNTESKNAVHPGPAKIHDPQTHEYCREPENREQRWRERGKAALEALTLLAVIFYGGVAYYQKEEMVTAN